MRHGNQLEIAAGDWKARVELGNNVLLKLTQKHMYTYEFRKLLDILCIRLEAL
jgi:hypothetical protein